MTQHVPENLKYTSTHEWLRDEGNGVAIIGITDHAQHLLGDIVFVELPDVERTVKKGEECGVVESVKAAADIYCPVAGEIIAVNEHLISTPDAVNKDAYGEGWLYKIQMHNPEELSELLDASAYKTKLEHS